ncbi:uncharacterized protein LOC101859616 isoform X2 [Aplysia californica]|uniref:Uncharacterized protein LOC101859616 isoform X2 n=1 Tax=Aplysia californica TaxID=6500 RepID=A0ABM1VXK0_APLCA|nr:uncharacterized protein LOC101859616 isoform X2 [Aplysia californica]
MTTSTHQLPPSTAPAAAATSRFHNDTGSWLVVLVYCAHVLPKRSAARHQTKDEWADVTSRQRALEEILEGVSQFRSPTLALHEPSSPNRPLLSILARDLVARAVRSQESSSPPPAHNLTARPDSLLTLRNTLHRIQAWNNTSGGLSRAHSLLPTHHVQCINTIAQAFSAEPQLLQRLDVEDRRQNKISTNRRDSRRMFEVLNGYIPGISHTETALSSQGRSKRTFKRDRRLKLVDKRMLRRYYESRYLAWPYDKKVFVYGKDDRRRIYPPLLRKFPYSNIVRLSTGCTGTLVTPFHVITAAHCVHDGKVYRENMEMLKVQIPDTMVGRVYYIEKIMIPGQWLSSRGYLEQQAGWDYAVVTLSYGVHGRSQFSPLSVPTAAVLRHNLQFLGFPYHGHGLWQSICPAKSNKAKIDCNIFGFLNWKKKSLVASIQIQQSNGRWLCILCFSLYKIQQNNYGLQPIRIF